MRSRRMRREAGRAEAERISAAATAVYAAYSAVFEAHARNTSDREVLETLQCQLFDIWATLNVLDGFVGDEEEVR